MDREASRRHPGWRKRASWLGAYVALSVALGLIYGLGWTGFDPVFSLIWARQIGMGNSPALNAHGAPTPHPLAILVALPLTLLPAAGALEGLKLLALLYLSALGLALVRLGRATASLAVGIAAAAIVLTRSHALDQALSASVDIPFLALTVFAVALIVERPRRYRAPLIALALAGLLRPDAWAIAIAYAVWLLAAIRPEALRDRIEIVILALIAPGLWMSFDLLATGDPLFSLHTTRAAAAYYHNGKGLGAALGHVPAYLAHLLGGSVLAACLLGLALAAVQALALGPTTFRRHAPLVAALAAALGGFLFLAISGLPVIERYALLPSALLSVYAGYALFSWRGQRKSPIQVGAVVVAAVTMVLIASGARRAVDGIRTTTDLENTAGSYQSGLTSLLSSRARAQIEQCPPLQVDSYYFRPTAAWALHRSVGAMLALPWGPIPAGTVLVPSRYWAANHLVSSPFVTRAVSPRWSVVASC